MTDCDETLTTLLFGRALDRDAAAHLAACPRCRAESAAVEGLERTLAWHVERRRELVGAVLA